MKANFKNRLAISLSVIVFVMIAVVTACTDGSADAKPNYVFKTAPKPDVVAKIAGQEITTDELIGDAKVKYFELKKKEHEFMMEQLKGLLVKKMIGSEAEKAKMSLDDYIKKNVTKGDIKISTSDYNSFLKEKGIKEDQVNPQLKERINEYLKENKKVEVIDKYVANLTKKSPVEVYFQKPKMDIQVAIDGAPVWGDQAAKVTIVAFSDFQCPFCQKAAETVDQIKKEYGTKKVKIAFKHFPLPMHPDAKPASEASMCVFEQDHSKFWKFHDLAFKNQRKLASSDLEDYAKQSGVDLAKFKECTTSGKFAKTVQEDLDYGERLGVRSTPTFFINGQLISGALPFESFKEVIDEELATTVTN